MTQTSRAGTASETSAQRSRASELAATSRRVASAASACPWAGRLRGRGDQAAFFVYGERGQPDERPANTAFYAAARGPKQLWEVPGSKHIGGADARPREYERRVVAFFDRYLLGKAG